MWNFEKFSSHAWLEEQVFIINSNFHSVTFIPSSLILFQISHKQQLEKSPVKLFSQCLDELSKWL